MDKKRLLWLYAGSIVFIFFFALFGEKGLFKIYKLNKDLRHLETKKNHLKKNNLHLSKSIFLMKKESAFQERISRETLGMAKEDEIIYEFSD